ncbi:MAG: zinc dependent phospholipase C family protein [Lachnospiraceae bacterium]|nr:zinc dependent phospholipase C family protein [Lachnospiraceae bacterium]
MPSRMIHYLIAEKVTEQVPIANRNRFIIGSLCPDMSLHTDGSKEQAHYFEIHGDKKGGNWLRFVDQYREQLKEDDLYLGILCHLITDAIWFHKVMQKQIRSKEKNKERRHAKYQEGYRDFHRLNYILRKEFDLRYELEEDRNIDFIGLHPELYDEVFDGLFKDFFLELPAQKENLQIYVYDITMDCIEICIEECVRAILAFRKGLGLLNPEKYFVPVY